MSVTFLTIIFFGALLACLVLGLPLSFTLGGVSMIFLYFTWGPEAFYMVAAQTWGNMNKFTIVAVPLFIFMAMILERSGVANDLYDMMYIWFGGVGGGLEAGRVAVVPASVEAPDVADQELRLVVEGAQVGLGQQRRV